MINPVETVYDLLNAVDQRTDWLWGFCRPHAIRESSSEDFLPWDRPLFWLCDLDSGKILELTDGLSITKSSSIQIVSLVANCRGRFSLFQMYAFCILEKFWLVYKISNQGS